MKNNVIQLKPRDLFSPSEQLLRFKNDVADLLTRRRMGHMEQWEYWTADYTGDPAGGAAFWQELILHPNSYYLPQADISMLHAASSNPFVDATLQTLDILVELGPGSAESVARKTIPFLKHARHYVAVDQAAHQAEAAATQVHEALGIQTSCEVSHYHYPPLPKEGRAKTGFVMWGGSIGNIEGAPGADGLPGLVRTLHAFAQNCNRGDVFFVGIDTENNPERLRAAYNHPILSRKFLSVLFAAKKFNLTQGHFTPESWSHSSVWHAESKQMAHYLIASEDQNFVINGEQVEIKAGQALLTNNSYKFDRDTVVEAARMAGFSRPSITSDSPMALLMAKY